ncbi:MAG: hypothetical protein M3Y12_13255 [Bacteroidota bacterium]|nr:hypothetical protein [Bacteroidota bacterium]
MTRATLLHVLECPTALGPAEVRELEQLAQAFPYCQTAHLLLAKAAHDQGTMLAGQRLRRAATYAADRTLLRRLIEQEEPAATPEPIVLPAAPHPLDLVDWPDQYVAPTTAPPAPLALPATVAEAPSVPAETLAPVVPAPAPVAPAQFVPGAEAPAADDAPLPELIAPLAPAAVPGPLFDVAAPLVAAAPEEPSATEAAVVAVVAPSERIEFDETPVATPRLAPTEATPAEVVPAETSVIIPTVPAVSQAAIAAPAAEETTAAIAEPAPDLITAVVAPSATATPLPETIALAPVERRPTELLPAETLPVSPVAAAEATPVAQGAETASEPVIEADLPAQAPAIRPPGEVGGARFEFGLADPVPVAPAPTYELPGLVDEWAASAVTRGLGSPEALTLAPPAPATPVFTPAAFTGDAAVGYAFGESSRLGLSMQLLDLLTAKAEAAESATAVVAAAQPPASALPPTGTFFEPDPLLLDHWATHRPVAPELPSTIDLINNFLKRQPRLTRAGMLPPSPGGQPDLSVRSTRAEPDLVSENLARIFVRQGKTARAIEIYEKLIVKQPEKMAYFALQIQSLQPSA